MQYRNQSVLNLSGPTHLEGRRRAEAQLVPRTELQPAADAGAGQQLLQLVLLLLPIAILEFIKCHQQRLQMGELPQLTLQQ